VEHYLDVHAILGLTEEFKEDSQLVPRLRVYSQQIVAAVLTHRLNSLGQQYKAVMRALTKVRARALQQPNVYGEDVRRLEAVEAEIRGQLYEAQGLVNAFFSPRLR
jgi:hypothetical protein